MTNDEWVKEAMELAHAWAIQSYYKGLGRPCDIDKARAALLAHLSARPEPQAAVSEERLQQLATNRCSRQSWPDSGREWTFNEQGLHDYARAVLAAARQVPVGWQPISTAPKDGRTLLLGYLNSNGKWRTLRGQWFSAGVIEEAWEDTECAEGWYETSVECEDDVNCWATEPTHWMPLPALPVGEPRQEEGEPAQDDEDEELDDYGNPLDGSEVINCCFPDCGCDGARLCMAKNGASFAARSVNLERGSLSPASKAAIGVMEGPRD